jgi:hypothetical protein
MEPADSSETLETIYMTMRCRSVEDYTLNFHRRESQIK